MTRFVAGTLGACALSVAATAAFAATLPAGPASITFADHDGVYDWRADGTRGLWVQDRSKNWYYATLMGPCSGLNFAQTLGFKTDPDGSLTQHSAVLFQDGGHMEQRCQFKTFERSAPPPARQKRPQPVQKAAPTDQ